MLLFLTGLAAGIISGMGIGGGAILIPVLVLFYKPQQQVAQSVNLLFFIPTAVIALFIHIKNKRVDFKTTVPIALAGLAGAYAGSEFAVSLSGPVLKKWFGIFLLAMGIYEIVCKGKKGKGTNKEIEKKKVKY